MKHNANNLMLMILAALSGLFIGYFLFSSSDENATSNSEEENEILYWVAPMDSNYRRDKPGKSPMGMDLVPVYKNDNSAHLEDENSIYVSPQVENNLGVRKAVAKYGQLDLKIKTVGYVKYDEDQLVHIHPRVEGWIEKLYIKAAGDPVKKDQPLYDIYSPSLVNAQEEYLLALSRKNKVLISAAENRLKALQIPKYILDSINTNKKVKQKITFYSPQDGVVDNLNIREGFYVKPGTTIMSIGKLDHVWVEAEVFERQSSQVTKGLLVNMTLDFLPGKHWKGKVDYIYPTLEPKTRTLKVRLRFENEQRKLKPNMFAQIEILAAQKEQQLLVPKESIIRTGNSNRVVLSLGEGRYKSVAVEVGRFDESHAEILSGLEFGDQVVSSAQFLLDSESSKSSDFKRMSYIEESNQQVEELPTAKVKGVINHLMLDKRAVNISREAIEKWNRPAATMDFLLDDSVELENISQGMQVEFVFYVAGGEFIISDIYSSSEPLNSEKD